MNPSMLIDALIRASVQGSAAVVAVWGLLAVWRKCPHQVRCWLWRLAFVKMIIGMAILNPLTLSVLPRQVHPVHNVLATESAPIQGYADVEMGETVELDTKAAAGSAPTPALPPPPVRVTVWQVIAWMWELGAATVIVLTLLSVARSVRMRAACQGVDDARLVGELESLCERLGLRRAPELLVSESCGPMVVGVFRPAIVLPRSYLDEGRFSDARLILAHEIAHITRRDLAWELMPTLARIAFFFNPFVYAANDQASLAREMACDAAALRLTNASDAQYARMLLDCVASGRGGVTCVGMAEAYGAMRSRILSVANPIRVSPARLAAIGALMVLAAAALIVPWSLTPKAGSATAATLTVTDTYAGLSLIPGVYKLSWDLRDPESTVPDYYPAEPIGPKTRGKIVGYLSPRARLCDFEGFTVIVDRSHERGGTAYVFPQSWLGEGNTADLRKAWRAPLRNEGDVLINEQFAVTLKMGRGADSITKSADFSIVFQPPAAGIKEGRISFHWRGGWFGDIKTTKGILQVHPTDDNRDGVYDTPKSGRYLCSACGQYHCNPSDDVQFSKLEESSGLNGTFVEGICPSTGAGIIAGRLYSVKMSPAGDSVSIQPYTGPTGILSIRAVDGFGRPAGFSVAIHNTDIGLDCSGAVSGVGSRDIPLPPGNYHLEANVGVPGAPSDVYSSISYDQVPDIAIMIGCSHTLNLGETIGLSISPSDRPIVASHGKKRLVLVSVKGQDQRAGALDVRNLDSLDLSVVDSSGNVVKTLNYDPVYTGSETGVASFDAGTLQSGTYTLRASYDFAPYSPKSSVSAEIKVKE